MIEKLGFKVNNVGDFFAYIGIWIALSQVIVTPFLAKRFKNHQVLRVALLGMAIALVLQLIPNNTAQLLILSPLIALFNGTVMANISALVSLTASAKNQGEILGIEASVQALAQAIPAIIAGYVATMGINMPIIVGSALIFVGWLIFVLFYKPPKDVELKEGQALAAH